MVSAHVLINCAFGSEKQVIDDLKKFDIVREVKQVYGPFDIVAKLESSNFDELNKNVAEDIHKIKKIISTITLMNIDGFSRNGTMENQVLQ